MKYGKTKVVNLLETYKYFQIAHICKCNWYLIHDEYIMFYKLGKMLFRPDLYIFHSHDVDLKEESKPEN